MLRVRVRPGPGAEEATAALHGLDSGRLVAVTTTALPEPSALVIAIGNSPVPEADALLHEGQPLSEQVASLWSQRIEPFAREMAGMSRTKLGPAVLREHDPRWPVAARRMLDQLRAGLLNCGADDGHWTYDHIGSTSVAGLRAKPYIDLQIGARPLPEGDSLADEAVRAAGFMPATGSRPDSPGVYRDRVVIPGLAPEDAYRKRLYFRPDPGQYTILHVRQLGSPWWTDTLSFRDRLRDEPSVREAYERVKLDAAETHAADADFDDYTRAKYGFFDDLASGQAL